jgi:MFS family permease
MPVFLITAFGVSLTTPFVYQIIPTYLEASGMSRAWISSAMTLGQWPEIAMLAALPWLFRRLGAKGTLAIGIAAWAVRYGSLALSPPLWVAVAGIPLHGVGIACFTVAGQVYTDSQAPREGRASAQALYMVVTSGVGSFLGCLLAGEVMGRFGGDYRLVFLVPCVIDTALIVYFCAGFRPQATTVECSGASNTARLFRNDAGRGTIARVGNLVTESADG